MILWKITVLAGLSLARAAFARPMDARVVQPACAVEIYDYLWNSPFVTTMREMGVHNGALWLTHYLCKMNSAIARGMCTYAKMRPDRREAALKTAAAAGEEMLKYAAKPGTPLAHFPPTYLPQEEMACDLRYAKGEWQKTMLVYPVSAAEAYLDL